MTNKSARQRTNKKDTIVGVLSSGTTTTITTTVVPCTIPSDAIGFRIYPTTTAIRFNVDADPATAGTVNAATAGAIAKPGAWEARLLYEGAATVRLLGTVTTTVDIEWF